MPANAYRKGHLWSHLAASATTTYSEARLRHLHPEWPSCWVCGYVINPAALVGGFTTHPSCDPATAQTRLSRVRPGRIPASPRSYEDRSAAILGERTE